MTNPTKSEQLRGLIAKATPGDWFASPYRGATGSQVWAGTPGPKTAHLICGDGDADDGDAALIVFLKNNADHFAQLEAENERLRGALHWREDALKHAQGRFLNINIALSTDRGKAVNQAITIADIGEDACKMARNRDKMLVRIVRALTEGERP